MLNMEMERLEDADQAEDAVREHLRKRKVQALIPEEEVALARDAKDEALQGVARHLVKFVPNICDRTDFNESCVNCCSWGWRLGRCTPGTPAETVAQCCAQGVARAAPRSRPPWFLAKDHVNPALENDM
jgi:hypothetical protein